MFVRWLPTVNRVSSLPGNLYSHALGSFHFHAFNINKGIYPIFSFPLF